MFWVCFISVETVPKVAAKAAKFLGKTFGTFLVSTRLKHTQMFFGSTVFNVTTLFKHKGHDGHKGKTYEIKGSFPPLCTPRHLRPGQVWCPSC
jgi:hypothetical protein